MKLGVACLAPFLAILIGCGPTDGGGDDPGPGPDTSGDTDADGISDADEGAAAAVDTDADGTPDYLDDDSDGDGIPDYREAGDSDLQSDPFDSDFDGTPDFRDLDSDNNGRNDDVDGVDDPDGDGLGDFADGDDDGDAIDDVTELGPNPAQPTDSDGDGIPDFRDLDSDNDTIKDFFESSGDFDGDGVANYLDLDSDDDCVPDQLESRGVEPPADSDLDTRADFVDRDSDNDGLADGAEDGNCNGTVDGGESSSTSEDTDGDGVSDLIEDAAGTDPTNPADNPQANGDFVFVEPYLEPQSPTEEDLDFSTSLKAVDLYVLLDRSGSMSTEIASVRNNLSQVVANLTCPVGAPTPGCIPDLWAGAATIGYTGTSVNSFQNWVDVQPNASFAGVSISEPPTGEGTQEPLAFAAYSAVTGVGGGAYGMPGVAARSACAGSPAGATGFGFGCFRANALSVVLLATDERPLGGTGTVQNPAWSTVGRPAYLASKARLVGILGENAGANTDSDLRTMATDTGAVDAANGNAPLVFNGFGNGAATAIENGIRTLALGLPLDINAVTTDDPADTVDAVASFVAHIETLQLGTPACANGLNDIDTNADSFDDKFLQVRTGTPVCWKVVSKPNTTVMPTAEPQLFRATVTVFGDGVTELDTRDVYFLVPPAPIDGPIGKR